MRNGDDRNAFEAEQEILAILSHMQIRNTDEDNEDDVASIQTDEPDTIPASPDTTPTDIPLILAPEEAPKKKNAPVIPKARRERSNKVAVDTQAQPLVTDEAEEITTPSPFSKVGQGLRNIFPKKGDPASEIVRKIVLLLSLAVCLVSVGFLTYYMVIEPNQVNRENDSYVSLFNDTKGNASAETSSETKDIQQSFRQLYSINNDIAGWLAFNSTDRDSFMKINLPVVWCGDNDTYLSRGFDGQYSRSGTLFFEQTNTFAPGTSNKVTIIYGHNMASGTMFAPLNKLIGNVYRARSAATIHLDTLYGSNQYKVFAVLVSDEGAESKHRFGYLRTTFADDTDFMNYVNELRARSLFDYPVDVQPGDQLLILSTCTNKSQVKVADGRLAVIARRVREGENTTTDTAKIVKNDDVIMPYAWYTAQSLAPHAFYTQSDFVLPGTVTAGGTTTTDGNETTTQTGDTTGTDTTTSTSATAGNTSQSRSRATTSGSRTVNSTSSSSATTEGTTMTTTTQTDTTTTTTEETTTTRETATTTEQEANPAA